MTSAELDEICDQAILALRPLHGAGAEVLAGVLQPRETDYAAVFVGGADVTAREGYRALWAAPPPGLGHPGQTEVRVVAARSDDIGVSGDFPGGYKRISHLVRIGRVWVMAKFTAPGERTGMNYDGFVWMGEGRFAWFPKPWRVLADADTSYS